MLICEHISSAEVCALICEGRVSLRDEPYEGHASRMSDPGLTCGIEHVKVGPQGGERNVNELRKTASVVICASSLLFVVRILVFENNQNEYKPVQQHKDGNTYSRSGRLLMLFRSFDFDDALARVFGHLRRKVGGTQALAALMNTCSILKSMRSKIVPWSITRTASSLNIVESS